MALRSFLALLGLLSACSRPQPALVSKQVPCAACHPEVAKTYQQTGMGRSFYRATPSNLNVEDFAKNNRVDHKASQRKYEMLRRGDQFYLRRHQTGYQGSEANVQELQIHYVMGSGNHARSYIHRTAENRLIELPVAWYPENGGYWAMSPGFDYATHPDARRKISYDCMFCHNAYPAVERGTDLPGMEPFFPDALPEGINCERCHGDGSQHVELAAKDPQGAQKETTRAAILNPKRLNAARQLEVCMQCHLETTSFALPNAVQRFDRAAFSYKPDEPLSSFVLHFDHATGHQEKFEIVNSVYRLRQSACFLKSGEGKLLCTTCHNPHRALRGAEAQRSYAAVCRNCHSAAHSPSPDCVSCHMPKRRTEDVVHTVMTDHKIQRRAPPNALLPRAERHGADAEYHGEVKLYYPPQLPAADRDLYVAAAQVIQKSNLSTGIVQLAAAIEQHKPSGPEFYYDLAQAYLAADQRGKAMELYQQAIAKRAEFSPAWRAMGAVLVQNGELARGVEALERARALSARDAVVREELARAYQKQGRLDQAIAEAREALRLDSIFPEGRNSLGAMLFEKGERTPAEQEYREAIRLRPDYAEAHNNLANLLAAVSDFAQADYHFDIAIRLAPTQAVTRYNYAVSLAVRRRFDEAQRQFEAAVRYAPTMAEAHESLGNLVARRGDWRGAIRHYEAALKAHPGFDRAILGIGTAYGGLGDLVSARRYLQQAANSSTPAVRNEALELLRSIP